MTKKIETNKVPQVKRSHKKKVIPIINGKNTNIADAIRATFRDAGIPVSTTRPATILYKKLPDDMILITGLEGFLSVAELEERYGKEIADTYLAYDYNMAKEYYADGTVIINVVKDDSDSDYVRPGKVLEKMNFAKLIAHVKKCGGLLHDIIQAVKKGEVKRVEI